MPPSTALTIQPDCVNPFVRPCDGELERLIKDLRQRLRGCKFPERIVPRLDSEFLAKFIRIKDYNVEKALIQIQKYYHCIYVNLDLHEGVRPSQVSSAMHSKAFALAKKENRPNGVGLIIINAKLWYPKEVSVREFQIAFGLIYEEYIKQVELQENGISLIADLEGIRFEQIWKITFKEIRRTAQAIFNGFPVRVKQVHVLNVPSIFWPVYKVARHIVKEKIHQRVRFHENLESLHECIEKEKLPIRFGGYLEEEEEAEKTVIERVLKEDKAFEEIWHGKYYNHQIQES